MKQTPVSVRVWGDGACFTRPELKVERVSYPCMTPSAARGVLEAFFWKPQFDWIVERIDVLEPIRFASILRNEVNAPASERSARKRTRFDANQKSTPRHTLMLGRVAYNIHATVRVRRGVGAPAAKYRDQFRRRVERGQCFWRPYLGCREFSAYFSPVDPNERPIEDGRELGRMLFDLEYDDRVGTKTFGQGVPVFFDARLSRGALHVPTGLYDRLLAHKENR